MNRPLNPSHLIERATARLVADASVRPPDGQLPLPPDRPTAPAWGVPQAARAHTPAASTAAPFGPAAGNAELAGEIDLATLERVGLFAGLQRSRIAEEFRIATSRLLNEVRTMNATQGLANLTMVTSARPGEGKTFASLNLAATIAREITGAVLLIDADSKLQSLSHHLGLDGRRGLLELARNATLKPETLLVPTAIHNLLVLPIGTPSTADAAEEGRRPLAAVIEDVARRFPRHLILLDAPPCLATSDPTALAPLVRQIVLIVQAGRTQRGEVVAALDLIRSCPNILLLLNKTDAAIGHTFGAYHYHGAYY
jgi:protein-tyrosine kinase